MSARTLIVFWLVVSLMCPGVACADTAPDYKAIFEKAVAAVEFDFDRRWAYTETRIDSEHVWVARSDPRRSSGERWQLISVDDREPTENEIKKFRKERARERLEEGDNQVNALVDPESIRVLEETDEYWLFGFVPDDEEDIMDSVDATIRVNKAHGHLEYIDLRNHSTIKPAFGVKISKLITRLTFGRTTDGGPVVPISTQVEAKGRAFLVVAFDELEVVRNSSFELVVSGAENGAG
ncbi:MAG: hypothetical protein OEM50_07335 [Gammaproteobacteria bacterium]|nr:hypothetical protein [Gammaproteobacteria bacterium]MDH3363249.1 hypothetical protein [Gammaproteobacteria bacterium]MDH3481517.1 hypothetical protein [Gammaproteobacteria bacterium]